MAKPIISVTDPENIRRHYRLWNTFYGEPRQATNQARNRRPAILEVINY